MPIVLNGTTGITTAAIDLTTPLSVADGGTGVRDVLPYRMFVGTAIATTASTFIDFTGIPSWAKRITVMLNGVSTNGASIVRILLGTSAGITTTGYLGSTLSSSVNTLSVGTWAGDIPTGNAAINAAASVRNGIITVVKGSDTTYFIHGSLGYSDTTMGAEIKGTSTLPAIIDRVRITTVNGIDLFDAGSVNIMYEGY